MNHRSDQLPDTFLPPGPPPELRQRVLSATRVAMDNRRPGDIWTRLWGSGPIRLAWASSIAVLLFGHLLIGEATPAGSDGPAFPLAAVVGNDDELAEIVGLQRMTVDLPGWELTLRDAITHEDRSIGNEEPS